MPKDNEIRPGLDFETLLQESVKIHGHLCPGQVLGVRMSLVGLREIGIEDPKQKDRKKIIVLVEMDRCATDAIQSVTGCSLGKRTMKFLDYGKMAATFLNLESAKAVRVIAREESRQLAKECFPEEEYRYKAQLEAYKILSDSELFSCSEVTVSIPEEDMPGRPISRVRCDVCGEHVQDRREIKIENKVLCRACAAIVDRPLQQGQDPFLSSSVMHNSQNAMTIRSKIWIEVDGEAVFGRGRGFLLDAIDKYGSVDQAAKEIDVSSHEAWRYIKSIEERLGLKLVDLKPTEKNCSNASLTDQARQLLKRYRMLEQGIHELVDDRFKHLFGLSDSTGCSITQLKTAKKVSVEDAVGMALAHDITEIRSSEFKGRAFKKGHIVRKTDIDHLKRLGKEHLFVLSIAGDELHEDEAAYQIADALKGEGIIVPGEPKEGKLNLVAAHNGLLKINTESLRRFNRLGEVMCATLHTNSLVKAGQIVGATRAIPLIVKREIIEESLHILRATPRAVAVLPLRVPKAGIVITGNEIYHGRIADAFGPIMTKKVEELGGEVVGIHYAPDDEKIIEARLRELVSAGADLLITTGGMSVDPDDVTRFAIRQLGARNITYGSAVLPGAMFLVAYLDKPKNNGTDALTIPILGIPACGMYHKTTIFDLVVPRLLAGEIIGRDELANLGHGGLCLHCAECRFPVCPFGK